MKFRFVIFVLVICASLLLITSCSKDSAGADVFGDVIVETENGFLFQDLDWMTGRDTIEKENVDAVYSDTLNRLEIQEDFTDGQRLTLYHLQEDHFYAGEYIVVFDEKSDYESYIEETKDQAENYFTVHKPMGNSLNDLQGSQEVSWEGADKSYFRIRTFEDDGKYSISFIVEAPKGLDVE